MIRKISFMLYPIIPDSINKALKIFDLKTEDINFESISRHDYLKSGHSISLTADQPPGPGKISGLGVITLSKISGIPIIPVSATTSKRYEFNNWDNFTINLPFGKGTVVWGDPILVDPKSSKEEMEKKRKILEKNLLKIFKESKENL